MDPTLTASAYQEKYLGMFWDLCQPPANAAEGRILRAYAADNWTAVARDIYCNCPTVRTALLAHCLATIGRWDNDRRLMVESLKYYTAALGKVRSDLVHTKRSRGDAVVVASRALASYEVSLLARVCLIHEKQLTRLKDSVRPGTRPGPSPGKPSQELAGVQPGR